MTPSFKLPLGVGDKINNYINVETTQTPETKKLEITTSRQFVPWLIEQNLSMAFTTYQAGKIFFIGIQPNGQLWCI